MQVKKSYEVGYCKPPKETQFQKGQSGNCKGRPKKERDDVLTLLQKEMHSQVTLADGQRISKEEAMVKQLANKAVKGDIKSQKIVLQLQDKGHRRTRGERLHDKLIDRNYLEDDDITDFLTENKILSVKDLCGTAYCHIRKTHILKTVKAAQCVVDNIVMTEFMRNAWRALYLGSIAKKIITEYEYWQGIDKVMPYVEEEKCKSLIKKLSRERCCSRPPENIYKEALMFDGIGKWLILRNWRELIDANMMVDGFDDCQKEFFSEEKKEKIMKDIKKEIPEDAFQSFEAIFREWIELYKSGADLPTADECQKHIYKYVEEREPIDGNDLTRENMIGWYRENANKPIDIPFPRM